MSSVIAFSQRKGMQEILINDYHEITGEFLQMQKSAEDLTKAISDLPPGSVLIIDYCPDTLDLSVFQGLENSIVLVLSHFGIKQEGVYVHNSTLSLFRQLSGFLRETNHFTSGFIPIPARQLEKFSFAPFNFYLKISNHRYRRKLKAFDEIDSKLLSSLDELYIEKKNLTEYSNLCGVFHKSA